MNPIAAVLILLGTSLSLVAGLGLVRLRTTYARVHAAGKASPISFLLIAAGCGVELGVAASAQLGVAALALVVTLPVASHLLFRAIRHTTPLDRPDGDRPSSPPKSDAARGGGHAHPGGTDTDKERS